MVDLKTQVHYLAEQKKFSVDVWAEPQGDSTASIEPLHFPYRLERLQGLLTYTRRARELRRPQWCRRLQGLAWIVSVSPPKALADFLPDGRWRVHFDDLCAERLTADRDLVNALPEQLKKVVRDLSPVGTINLHGAFELERSGLLEEPLQSRWDVRLDSTQASIRCGSLVLENIHGAVWLKGGFDGTGGFEGTPGLLAGRTDPRFAQLQRLSLQPSDGPDLDRRRPGAVRLVRG